MYRRLSCSVSPSPSSSAPEGPIVAQSFGEKLCMTTFAAMRVWSEELRLWTEDTTVSCNCFSLARKMCRPADHGLWKRLLVGNRCQHNASTRLPRSAGHMLSTSRRPKSWLMVVCRPGIPFQGNQGELLPWKRKRRKEKKKRASFGKEFGRKSGTAASPT